MKRPYFAPVALATAALTVAAPAQASAYKMTLPQVKAAIGHYARSIVYGVNVKEVGSNLRVTSVGDCRRLPNGSGGVCRVAVASPEESCLLWYGAHRSRTGVSVVEMSDLARCEKTAANSEEYDLGPENGKAGEVDRRVG